MHALKRYPAAGFWVSYNRTRGESATVTITMQAYDEGGECVKPPDARFTLYPTCSPMLPGATPPRFSKT